MKNYEAKLEAMRKALKIKECLLSVLDHCESQRNWYTVTKVNEETGELLKDEDGETLKFEPTETDWDYSMYQAWTMVINAIEKQLDK